MSPDIVFSFGTEMIALLQRVLRADCKVEGHVTGEIDSGLLVFACAERNDTEEDARKLAQRVLRYRLFSDENGKMNLSVSDVKGGILVISQFTLAADTDHGNRPSFTPAADPETGKKLFSVFLEELQKSDLKIQTGVFGAHMQISLVNDGPVTFWLRYPK